MDQDIHFQHKTAFGAKTTYFLLPYRCTVRNVSAIVQADPGDNDTVTVTHEPTVGGTSTAIGIATFGATIAAGAVATWAANATTGATVLEAGTFLKIVTSAGDPAVCNLDIELDPYAR